MDEKIRAELEGYRAAINELDDLLIEILAKRFAITHRVGELKKAAELPSQDHVREQNHIAYLRERAVGTDLDPDFAERLMTMIFTEVVATHQRIKEER